VCFDNVTCGSSYEAELFTMSRREEGNLAESLYLQAMATAAALRPSGSSTDPSAEPPQALPRRTPGWELRRWSRFRRPKEDPAVPHPSVVELRGIGDPKSRVTEDVDEGFDPRAVLLPVGSPRHEFVARVVDRQELAFGEGGLIPSFRVRRPLELLRGMLSTRPASTQSPKNVRRR